LPDAKVRHFIQTLFYFLLLFLFSIRLEQNVPPVFAINNKGTTYSDDAPWNNGSLRI